MSKTTFKSNLAVLLAQTLDGLCDKYKIDTENSLVGVARVDNEDHLVNVSIAALIRAATTADEPEAQEEENDKATRDELVELVRVLMEIIDQASDMLGLEPEDWGMELNGVTTDLADYIKKFVGRI